MQAVELLAPARDLENGIAAINCGADAVYMGAARFGAREAAGNPLETIEQLARYAHRYWAKVYVTINTLLQDEEIEPAVDLIHALYGIGVDAIILQDAGLLECSLPPIALFASTQMHNHTPERVAFLEKVGIQRAILARELSLAQIRAIRAQTTHIELESFVHGALCVSYSGQCYLSYALGGRSGNRGQCAQPCRRLYRLVDARGNLVQDFRHLLSLRDMNLSEHLQSMLDAGVRSFKIEGRLKDQSYVMNVVGLYRQKLDEILASGAFQAASSGHTQLDFTPDPLKTFNRGYTSYFLLGKGAPLASWDTPKSLGEPLGKVAAIQRRSFTLTVDAVVQRGDGLCFFDSARQLRGATVNDVQGSAIFPSKMEGLAPGATIYRNHDHAFLAALEKSRAARPFESRKITARLQVDGVEDQPGQTAVGAPSEDALPVDRQDSNQPMKPSPQLRLRIEDQDGNQAVVLQACEPIPAEKPDLAREGIQRQLSKLGGTEYACAGVEIHLPVIPFIPAAVLNALRRSAVEALTAAREANRPRALAGDTDGRNRTPNAAPFPTAEVSFEGNILNRKAEAFYRRHGVTRFERAAESGLNLRGRKVMTTRYCIKYELGACHRYKALRLPVQRLEEPLVLVDEQNNRFPLRFNCARCEMEVYFQEGPHESP